MSRKFVKYPTVLSSTITASFDELRTKIADELENGIDPMYELTASGDKLSSIVQSVEGGLGLYVEPSVQAGVGANFIYDEQTMNPIAEVDYQDWEDAIYDMLMDSDNIQEFKSAIRNYYEGFMEA